MPECISFIVSECFGVGFTQKRNTLVSSKESLTDVVTELKVRGYRVCGMGV